MWLALCRCLLETASQIEFSILVFILQLSMSLSKMVLTSLYLLDLLRNFSLVFFSVGL